MKSISPATRAASARAANAARRAQELARSFKILANSNRLKIVVFLDERERSVSEIEAGLGIHQPTLSQQLGELRDSGLIAGRRAAKSVIYSLTDGPGRRALDTIYLANGNVVLRKPAAARKPSHQAAVFASILPTRGLQATDRHPVLKSLLQE